MILSYFQGPLALCFLLTIVHLVIKKVSLFLRRSKIMENKGCKTAQSKLKLRDPIIGLDHIYDKILGRIPETYLDHAHKDFERYGQTYVAERWTQDLVYTCHKDNIKQILGTGFDDWELPGFRVASMASLVGQGIFTLNGTAWSHARGILRPSLTKRNLEEFDNLLEKHFQAFLRRIPSDGSIVDLQPLFFEITMDLATESLMGLSSNMLEGARDHEKAKQFIEDSRICSYICTQKMQMGPLNFCVFSLEGMRAKKRIFEYIDEYVDKCLEQQTNESRERYNVLHEIAKSTNDRTVLRDQVLHVLMASRDTAASLLSSLFFMLAKRPDIYAKLRAEVLRVAGEQSVTNDQLQGMTYLKWCIQEAQRIYPVVPANARTAKRDTTLPHGGGADGKSPLFIRKGVVVVYNMYSLHRDPDVFGDDPEEFRPERWDGIRPGWSFLPFSGGPRICIGQSYAIKELNYIVARMVQTFGTMTPKDDSEWTELYALLMTCKNGVHVSLRKVGTEA